MKLFLAEQKRLISAFLEKFLLEKENQCLAIDSWGKDLCQRLFDFSINGKMIRGALVSLAYSLYQKDDDDTIPEDVVKTAALMELIQSGLLIHDDIMDRDVSRRGKDSLFFQYKKVFDQNKVNDSYHTGEAFGICVGDIAYFFAFQIISMLNIDLFRKNRLIEFLSQELATVGLAQMMDVYWGASGESPDQKDILKLYTYKTGRYTFSLPLWLGALQAEASENDMNSLVTIGENLGVVFQIKDDELDLYQNQSKTGKPQGSDLRSGKYTLFIEYLLKEIIPSESQRFNAFFGKGDLNESDLLWTLELLNKYGIQEKMESIINLKNETVYHHLDKLNIRNSKAKDIFIQLIEYNRLRKV
ncbi:MAG: polyprenyl synthetase family protein [Spirochaetales bacterium]|nr:polyprenyl synthetase family protein [Spirochaetales bacterium]